MVAYLLLLVAVLTRVLPHAGWLNFTAVGGALLYFGARRPWREMLVPLAVLAATDYFLTVFAYHYAFSWTMYLPTWAWYVMAMALGQILLSARTSFVRVAAAALLGPTSFFVVSNYAVWAAGTMYPHTLAGLADLLCGGDSVLPERSGFDGGGTGRGVWGSRAAAALECGSCADGACGEVTLFHKNFDSL